MTTVRRQTTSTPAPARTLVQSELLQRRCACGGSAVSSLTGVCEQCKEKRLQAKLAIGATNDPLEQEADRIADQVLATPPNSAVSSAPPRIQRFTGQSAGQADTAPASVDRVLASPGRPLDSGLQQDMEQRFGHDFSRVRVHSGATAEQSAREMNAHAYTVGQNIVFGAGRFAPASHGGRRLIAHELTHVVQQTAAADRSRSGLAMLQRQTTFPSAGPGVLDETSKKAEPITRSEQAKHQYGLECLGDSVMFMIQSYGLVPPDMSRQEFEHAFTPLKPPGFSKTDPIKVAGIEQKGAMPVDLFSKALEGTINPAKATTSIGNVTKTEATLRGADSGSLSAQDVVKKLPEVFSAFKAQSQKPGYEFMKTYRPSLGAFEAVANDEFAATGDLKNNAIGDEYFQKGNTVLVELCLIYPATSSVGHRCVVVGKAQYKVKDTAGQNHYLYPADDPWYGSTLVMVPPDTDGWVEKDAKAGVSVDDRSSGLLKFKGKTVLQVAQGDNHVYRRRKTNP